MSRCGVLSALFVMLLCLEAVGNAATQELELSEFHEQALEVMARYVDGPVYRWGDADYPREKSDRLTCTFLSRQDGDFDCLFEDSLLFDAIGQHIAPLDRPEIFNAIGFVDGESELAWMIEVDDEVYIGFKHVPIEVVNLLVHYDRM